MNIFKTEQDAFKVFKLITTLRIMVNYHSRLYYELDTPEITDADFDKLYIMLEKLEAENPWSVTAESPTQKVGGKAVKGFKKIKHREPMRSLDKVHSEAEFKEWDKRMNKLLRSSK